MQAILYRVIALTCFSVYPQAKCDKPTDFISIRIICFEFDLLHKNIYLTTVLGTDDILMKRAYTERSDMKTFINSHRK